MIRTITIDHPPLNILTLPYMKELTGELRSIREDERVVMIRGAGEHFCAGVDVAEHLPGRGGEEMIEVLEALFTAVDEVPVPTISVVWGSCLGGGLELASACDFMIVSEIARLGQPEIKLGVTAPIALARLPRRIGRGRALDLLLTGREIEGREAERIGLATLACPEHEVKPRAADLAQRMSSFSPVALRTFKKSIRETEGLTYRDAVKKALEIYRNEVLESPDAIEGLNAFLEKREPRW